MTNVIKPDQLLTSHEVGALLQMDPSSVVKWVNDGILPAYRTPGGHRRIRSSELLVFLREHNMFVPDVLKGEVIVALVVDDDAHLLQALGRSMKTHKEKIELHTVTSGIEALVKVGALHPDALVIDVHMPEVDGLEVCRRLKANAETKGIDVILMTGKPSTDLEKKAAEAGARTLLVKPITAGRLLEVLTEHPGARHR